MIITLAVLLAEWSRDRAFALAGAGEDLIALLTAGLSAPGLNPGGEIKLREIETDFTQIV